MAGIISEKFNLVRSGIFYTKSFPVSCFYKWPFLCCQGLYCIRFQLAINLRVFHQLDPPDLKLRFTQVCSCHSTTTGRKFHFHIWVVTVIWYLCIITFIKIIESISLSFKRWLVSLRTYVNIYMLCYAKSLQSCPALCDPIDGSPPGSPVPGIVQARTLEWVAISFSNAWK